MNPSVSSVATAVPSFPTSGAPAHFAGSRPAVPAATGPMPPPQVPTSAVSMPPQMPVPAASMPSQMPVSGRAMPPMPASGHMPPASIHSGFGTDSYRAGMPSFNANAAANAAPNVPGEAVQNPPTFGGPQGPHFERQRFVDPANSSFPKPPGSNEQQMLAGPPMPNMYSNQPSASFGPPGMPGAPVNYGGSAGMNGPPMHGDMMGAVGPGMYQQRPRLDPNLMPSVVCISFFVEGY